MEDPILQSTGPLQRLPQPRSLFKLLPNRANSNTFDQDGEETKPEQSQSPATIPMDHSIHSDESPSAAPVPEEVTVVTDDDENSQPVTCISLALMIELLKKRNERLHGVEEECRQFHRQLHKTQGLVDELTRDLNRSRSQVAELIQQNSLLLNELKAVAEADNVSVETQQMMRVELLMLKACLFVAALFVLCGGKVEFLAVLALVWLGVDVAG